MAVSIPPETLKDIADYLDMGMICFYHIRTGELEYYPDELRVNVGFDEELWQETIDKVGSDLQAYIRFEGMGSHESFMIIESFVAEIADARIRQRFVDAISFKKPFQNFKQLLRNYPVLEQQWFAFKSQQYIEQLAEQVENYNSLKG